MLMKIEKGTISSSQLLFLAAAFVQGAALVVAFAYVVTKHDVWIIIISGLAVTLPFLWGCVSLAKSFPGQNMVQIMESVYGTFLGKGLSILFISFPFQVISHNLRFIGDFFVIYMYPKTPLVVFLILFIAVCAWAVRSGIETIARIGLVTVAITIFIDVLTFFLLLGEMEATNFLPMFELSVGDFIQGTHIMFAIPYGELMIFLMIVPYVNKIKQAKSALLWGLTIGAATLLILVVRDIAALGSLANVLVAPSFEAVRLIDIAHVITRMELLVAIVLLITVFIKISVLYYASALGIAQIFGLRTYRPLVIPIAIFSVSFSMVIYDAAAEQMYVGANIWPVYSLLFYMLPVMTMLIAKFRRLPRAQEGVRP
ncbi:spore germination protein KB [Evansella caseinilytica]|uniref:Spore germination protein KB n=1 Tax=Evansella caseinilytica TaxID=1503961 RepID=A0A1H3UZ92_9BACI|nr:endospore germination permease [Evansella caseinilytica]SDZ67658.1 spore germination protein KB [Evansella caseinilytica]